MKFRLEGRPICVVKHTNKAGSICGNNDLLRLCENQVKLLQPALNSYRFKPQKVRHAKKPAQLTLSLKNGVNLLEKDQISPNTRRWKPRSLRALTGPRRRKTSARPRIPGINLDSCDAGSASRLYFF